MSAVLKDNPKHAAHSNLPKEELVPRMNLTHHATRLANVMTFQGRAGLLCRCSGARGALIAHMFFVSLLPVAIAACVDRSLCARGS